jgi:hypothetical protein
MAAGELLEAFDERLPRYDRVNAARAVEDLRTAQSATFDTQHAQHDDEPLHLQLTESLLAFSDQVQANTRHIQLAGMDENQLGGSLHLALSPRLAMDIEWNSIRRQSTNARVVSRPPGAPVGRSPALENGQHRHAPGMDAARGLATDRRLAAQPRAAPGQPPGADGELGWHQPSEESLACAWLA